MTTTEQKLEEINARLDKQEQQRKADEEYRRVIINLKRQGGVIGESLAKANDL